VKNLRQGGESAAFRPLKHLVDNSYAFAKISVMNNLTQNFSFYFYFTLGVEARNFELMITDNKNRR
jgi:hypothetical protein